MESAVTRDEAFELLKQYNKEPFHIQHALTVEGVMKWYANELGFGQEEDYWGITGLFMILTLNFIRKNTAKKHRSSCGQEVLERT